MRPRMAVRGATFPGIEVRTQPAQSPDFNINDLALFRALKVQIKKGRRGPHPDRYNVEKLVADVLREWAEYSSEKLEEMWQYKQWVMGEAARLDGVNTYERHRKRAARS